MRRKSNNNVKPRLIWLDPLIASIEEKTGENLSDLQITIIKGAYYNESYEQIAAQYGCSKDHAKRVGSSLWSLLSRWNNRRIDKRNLKLMLDRFKQESSLFPQDMLEPPVGFVPSDSSFYVKRSKIESICLQTIMSRGGLIKICAPAKMGKTSLTRRVMGLTSGCRSVYLDLHLSEREALVDLERFLKWFSLSVARGLKLPSKLEEYWDDDLGCKSSCSFYFEEYLLASLEFPLILAFDKLDYLFKKQLVAGDFFALLRSWHENSKIDPNWSKLRLILVYDKPPPSLDSDKSPFNVGLTVSGLEFSAVEILDLAGRHGLSWGNVEVERLMKAVGGHPYLIRQALYEMATENLCLNEFLQQDFKKLTPYKNYL